MQVRYTAVNNSETGLAPRLSLVLYRGQRQVEVNGLVDSGSAINLLPYPVGVALGAVWDEQPVLAPIVGSLGRMEARGITVLAVHPQLTLTEPVRLVFAWTQTEEAPVLFGQMNFFMEFEVCFYKTQNYFELTRSQL